MFQSSSSAALRLSLAVKVVAGTLIASVLIWMMWSTGRADAGSLLAAPRAPPVWLLAMAIGYSSVHTGVHYPGDMLAGAVVGTCVGVTAASVARAGFARRS